ncbi:MAG: UDP-N-acetylmuramate:L-alanyl-gamma-D-glutamyl-meso-diaminopimelate ligase [Gammaproteobacteria bacterium]|nr:UDP-N-acetylmuramate:L-alanyl-gamma-D-glutamyl-meso-diaminopimelate ligase [Gammaproteobacteria bacterium]
MHIHILGICGTFMGSLAQLAAASGHRVTGSDADVYPPMSDQLQAAGIALIEGYDPAQLQPAPDLVVIGNALSRGNPCVEAVLERGLNYTSGPQWLGDHLLPGRWVLAVAGTHGKTTTASLLAWILEAAGLAPGFLIGGVPGNFGVSARLGASPFFVVEADEYDTAFFDKRSKFVHYRPRTVVLNNLEYDHADIFPDLAAIQTQFHHLIRTVPASGRILWPAADAALAQVLERGCWSETETTGAGGRWQAQLHAAAGTDFAVTLDGAPLGEVKWTLTGAHNVANALAAIAAARHAGVTPAVACQALGGFRGVKRRLECLFDAGGIRVYDDFAHHPTAIATTLEGLRRQVGDETIVAILEPRSNTMKLGVHRDQLGAAVACADRALWYRPAGLDWSLDAALAGAANSSVVDDIDVLLDQVAQVAAPAHLVIMSNGGFQGFQRRLVARLARRVGAAS